VVFVYGATWPWPGGDVRMFHDEDGQRAVRVGRQPDAEATLYNDEQDDEERRVLYVALTRARARLYLPRYPGRSACDLRGAYRFLNERLHALLGGITPDEVRGLFRVEPIACPQTTAPVTADAALAGAIAAWQPPPALLTEAAPDPAFHEAATARAGFIVTSYSAVRKLHGRFVPAETLDASGADASDRDGDDAGDDGGGAAGASPGVGVGVGVGASVATVDLEPARWPAAVADELPRGRLSGSFLHEVIEHLPLDTLAGPPPLDEWRRLPEVAALFERMRRRHDRQPAHLPHAQRLIHTALTAPVRLGDVIVPGLAGAAHPTREMEFLYPIPERRHPGQDVQDVQNDGLDGGLRWRIERGVVKGFIDYLFEHEGRVFVCDWKSDWLPRWDAAALAAHCEQSYAVQAELYTVATLRLLDIGDAAACDRRWGGVLYCFLRGMRADDPDAGIFFRRPGFDEITRWRRAMLAPAYWGRS
jgi:exodeoxyribonuclease V beta subunit